MHRWKQLLLFKTLVSNNKHGCIYTVYIFYFTDRISSVRDVMVIVLVIVLVSTQVRPSARENSVSFSFFFFFFFFNLECFNVSSNTVPPYVLILLCSVTIKAFVIFDREIVLYKFSIILCSFNSLLCWLFSFILSILSKKWKLHIVNCCIISIRTCTINI